MFSSVFCSSTSCGWISTWNRREVRELMAEQRRTNRLLETALFGGIGFALGLLVMLALVRQNIF